MWTELAEDADVSGGLRSEVAGLPAQPAVIKEYGRFAYLEGKWRASAKAGQEELPSSLHSDDFPNISEGNVRKPVLVSPASYHFIKEFQIFHRKKH